MSGDGGNVEFGNRFRAHIVKRLTVNGSKWTQEQAEDAAMDEWEAYCEYDTERGPPDTKVSPESAADEALSYWEDDGDE